MSGGSGSYSDTVGGNGYVRSRVEALEKRLELLEGGGKIELSPDICEDRLVIEMLSALDSNGGLNANPELYYYTPAHSEKRIKYIMETDTAKTVTDLRLEEEATNTRQLLEENGIHNFEIAGELPKVRDAGNLIVTPLANLAGLLKAVRTIRENLDILGSPDGDPRRLKSVIIDNSGRDFDAFVQLTGIYNSGSANELRARFNGGDPALGLKVVDNQSALASAVREVGADTGMTPQKCRPLADISSADKPFLIHATGNDEKRADAVNAIDEYGFAINIRTVADLGNITESDPEFDGTCSGNCRAKISTTMRDLREFNPSGWDNRFIFSTDGGGFFKDRETARKIASTHHFDSVRHLIHEDAGFPGVDTKEFITAFGGVEEFYGILAKAVRELEDQGEQLDLSMDDTNVLCLASLDGDSLGSPRFIELKVSVPWEFTSDPRPAGDHIKKSRHFQAVPGTGKTVAELGKEGGAGFLKHVPLAIMLKKALEIAGAAKTGYGMRFVNDEYGSGDLELLSNANFYEGGAVNIPAALRREMRKKKVSFRHNSWRVDTPDDLDEFVGAGQVHLLLPGLASTGEPWSREEKADFVLHEFLYPLTVAILRQVDQSPTELVAVTQNGKDPAVMSCMKHWHRTGMMGSDPGALMRVVSGEKEFGRALDEVRREYRAGNLMKPDKQPGAVPESGRDHVPVFLSSMTSVPAHLKDTFVFTHNLAMNGNGVITGMGSTGGMGIVNWAMLRLKASGHEVFTAGVQEHSTNVSERPPEELIKSHFGNESFFVVNGMMERMHHLYEVDKMRSYYNTHGRAMTKAAAFLAGGLGTGQELAYGLWLKLSGDPAFSKLNFVILNRKLVSADGQERGPYDAMLGHLGPVINGDPFVHVVSTPEEGIKKMSEIYVREYKFHNVEPDYVGPYAFEHGKNTHLTSIVKTNPVNVTGLPELSM